MLMLDQTPLTSTPTCGRNHRNGRAVWTETGGRFPPKSEGGFRRNMHHIREEAHLADHQLQRADFLGRSLQSNRLRFQRADPLAQFQDAGLELLAGDEALRVA